jgi:TonB family protein
LIGKEGHDCCKDNRDPLFCNDRPSVQAAHPKMASATTREFVVTTSRRDAPPFSVIEQKGLIARLGEELARAANEISRDPRGFIQGLFSADTKDAKRRRRIYAGLACALSVHVALLLFIAYVGWHHAFVKNIEPQYKVDMIDTLPKAHTDALDQAKSEVPRGRNGGGGGGGEANAAPATKGAPPKMSPLPQIVKPTAPSAPLPSIPLPPTIVGPNSAAPLAGVALGVPTGPAGEAPSPGEGTGPGIGGGNGTGAGTGDGPGGGAGSGGGKGNKKEPAGLPGGAEAGITGPVDWSRLKDYPVSTGITWLRRPTPVTTPEAQVNKVRGEVLLRATFKTDGTITDIQVVKPVPYMTESAIDALERSRFRPATIQGVPVTVRNVIVRINVTVGER